MWRTWRFYEGWAKTGACWGKWNHANWNTSVTQRVTSLEKDIMLSIMPGKRRQGGQKKQLDRWYRSMGRQEPGRDGKTGWKQKGLSVLSSWSRLPSYIGHGKLILLKKARRQKEKKKGKGRKRVKGKEKERNMDKRGNGRGGERRGGLSQLKCLAIRHWSSDALCQIGVPNPYLLWKRDN